MTQETDTPPDVAEPAPLPALEPIPPPVEKTSTGENFQWWLTGYDWEASWRL